MPITAFWRMGVLFTAFLCLIIEPADAGDMANAVPGLQNQRLHGSSNPAATGAACGTNSQNKLDLAADGEEAPPCPAQPALPAAQPVAPSTSPSNTTNTLTDLGKDLSSITDPGSANQHPTSDSAGATNAANNFGRDANGIRQNSNQNNSITTKTQFGIMTSSPMISGAPTGGIRPIAPANGGNYSAPKSSSGISGVYPPAAPTPQPTALGPTLNQPAPVDNRTPVPMQDPSCLRGVCH